MNEEERFGRLVRAARMESVPKVNVCEPVMRRLQTPAVQHTDPLGLITALSAAAAVVVVAWAAHAWQTWQDPITGLLCMANMVMP